VFISRRRIGKEDNHEKTAGGIMFGIAFFLLSGTILHVQLKQSILLKIYTR
jgi:hypothetical protein